MPLEVKIHRWIKGLLTGDRAAKRRIKKNKNLLNFFPRMLPKCGAKLIIDAIPGLKGTVQRDGSGRN
jgi:hypothetical protein